MQYTERLIARQCIKDLLDAGYVVTVNDGEENTLIRSTHPAAIFAAMGTTDEDWLLVIKPGDLDSGSFVRFVYGNDGPDVICDYGVSLEETLKRTNALAEELSA
jgi:hypothetical protein